jgi:hypothetical protein
MSRWVPCDIQPCLPQAKKKIIAEAEAVRSETSEWGFKCFITKILTSELFAVKILQTLFANPAPVKALRGGRGVPSTSKGFPEWDKSHNPRLNLLKPIAENFRADFHK